MQTLGLNEETDAPRKSFWRRQIQPEATASQRRFDWIFGVVMPVVCFFFDPIVFKSASFGAPLLANYKPFAYILSFVSILAMMAWLLFGEKLKWFGGFLAGLFLVGGIVSLGVGVVLFPLSVVGLIMLIGILGFTPLFSALVYLRNASRAFRSAASFLEKGILVKAFALAALLSAIVPVIANQQLKKSLDKIIDGDAATIRAEAQKLKWFAPLVNFDVFERRSRFNNTEEEQKALVDAFYQLTGEDLEKKSQMVD
jgi:hypothetical protein